MKIILRIIGGILLLFAVIAGISSARDWLVLNHLTGYEEDVFTIAGTRAVHGTGDEGTDYYLRGKGGKGEYEFAISAARYEMLSKESAVGQEIRVFRNPTMPNLVLQKESLGVIFEDDWRAQAEVASSAKSTMWIALIALFSGVFVLVVERALARRRVIV